MTKVRPLPAPSKPASARALGTSRERADFGPALLDWGRRHGRANLPWQVADPYAVWVSEIMLQQTQVETVKSYFERFMNQFPTVRALAAASEEAVLSAWAGLGYYRRAKFMHKAAILVVAEHGGELPRAAADLAGLPGIGRSTAAAIASLCHGERAAIMDGNVARVLARRWAMKEDAGTAAGRNRLWLTAQAAVDAKDPGLYTQSVMDLGATVCLPRSPRCAECPFETVCKARARGEPTRYPIKARNETPRRSSDEVWRLWTDGVRVGMRKNTDGTGVWQSMAVFGFDDKALMAACGASMGSWSFEHAFSHYDLRAQVELVAVSSDDLDLQADRAEWLAVSPRDAQKLPLPTPIKACLAQIVIILKERGAAMRGARRKKGASK